MGKARFEKLLDDSRKVDLGNYEIGADDVRRLAEMYNNNFVNASYDMFRIGFLKGQRAEQARQRKAAAK